MPPPLVRLFPELPAKYDGSPICPNFDAYRNIPLATSYDKKLRLSTTMMISGSPGPLTDDLTLGIALPQTIGATSREWQFNFIDWKDWRANSFQVTSEYTVTEPGGTQIRVDLVLFVNGIPLGVIEVKASHISSDEGVGQQIRNQKAGDGVPALFYSAQLLLAANNHEPLYGTVGTPRKLWSVWREREDNRTFLLCPIGLDRT